MADANVQFHCFVNFPQVRRLIVQQQCFSGLPPSYQGVTTINLQACSFITSHNGHCVFGTYWLAIGSACPFINHSTTRLPLFSICLSRVWWHQASWDTWSAIHSNCLSLCDWNRAGCDAQRGISSIALMSLFTPSRIYLLSFPLDLPACRQICCCVIFLSCTLRWLHHVEHNLFSGSLHPICLLHGLQTRQIIPQFLWLFLFSPKLKEILLLLVSVVPKSWNLVYSPTVFLMFGFS